jgi:ParB family chromosome partitioning protein
MSKRTGLGRGLEALIPAAEEPPPGVQQVPVDAIARNPMQPRSGLDRAALEELAASIREHGLIQPLVVTAPTPGEYQLIAGERRLEAARLAGLTHVPVLVKEATPQQVLELALVENIQRADLNPLEEASAYRQLIDDFGLTQEAVAARVGKSRATIANTVRLLRLPEPAKIALGDGRISEGHARALLGLDDEQQQLGVLVSILRRGLNVRQTEELVRRMTAPLPDPAPEERPAYALRALEDEFRRALGTKVQLHRNRQGRGRLVIHFYSEEELQTIYDAIVGDVP